MHEQGYVVHRSPFERSFIITLLQGQDVQRHRLRRADQSLRRVIHGWAADCLPIAVYRYLREQNYTRDQPLRRVVHGDAADGLPVMYRYTTASGAQISHSAASYILRLPIVCL